MTHNVQPGSSRDLQQQQQSFQAWRWQSRRQIGLSPSPSISGSNSQIMSTLYSGVKCTNSWDPVKTTDHTHHGGIFNFDFSPDGKLLVAACEGGSVLMFDPLNARLVGHKNKAHSSCVNCVRFLDSRLFATCSDDSTVALWDARYLKNRVQTFTGHLSWVKNIEYASNSGLLVTSGFDGYIYTWDINNYSEIEPAFNHIFHTSDLMRSKLTPDNSKLVISLSRGYIIVIHDLDLSTLSSDLRGFKPHMYRLIQMSQDRHIQMEHLSHYTQFFQRRRNRVEFISDFPQEIDAEVIASLQVHPQGWCILSRSISSNEKSEWTCIHDIQQPMDTDDSSTTDNTASENDAAQIAEWNADPDSMITGHGEPCMPLDSNSSRTSAFRLNGRLSALRHLPNRAERRISEDEANADDDFHVGGVQIDMAILDRLFNRSPFSRSSGDQDEQHSATIRIPVSNDHPERLILNWDNFLNSPGHSASNADSNLFSNPDSQSVSSASAAAVDVESPETSSRHLEYITLRLSPGSRRGIRQRIGQRRGNSITRRNQVHQNHQRLLCYAEEPNVGQGFIKELCFSTDGRLVCSPFGYGVRLLSFNPSCEELCDCVPTAPVKMYEVTSNMCHSNVVVTCKFSPVHCLLVSGCLSGKASFHQPVL